jgi:hypothetical protein
MNVKYGISVALATLALLTAAVPASADGNTLTNARDATAAFTNQAAAQAAGYDLLTDADGLACIDMPGQGAMGVHYVKGALVQAGTIDAARPQAVVYEVQPDGHLGLVALEYVVLQAAWDGAHPAPPELFGEKFTLTPAGNRYGLPAFYALHAWIWKHNPSGMFSSWNPLVGCGGAPSGNAATEDDPDMVAAQMQGFNCALPADGARPD